MNVQRFMYDCPTILTELGLREGVSTNVCFMLDAPLAVSPNDVIELDNGQWYLLSAHDATRVLLNGKWDRACNLWKG